MTCPVAAIALFVPFEPSVKLLPPQFTVLPSSVEEKAYPEPSRLLALVKVEPLAYMPILLKEPARFTC